MDPEFRRVLQERTAQVAIGAATLRNQGGRGVILAVREVLMHVDLSRFVVESQWDFHQELNRITRRVERRIPGGRWGTARKGLNIFLRDVLYNTYLERDLGFRRVERWLELPLDSYTVQALRREHAAGPLPRWPGVATVDWQIYSQYQAAANRVADERGIARVHLDAFWWRQPLSAR